jgi:hypothetical protein
MTLRGNPLSRSLSGVKRTWRVAAHMSASDPKRVNGQLLTLSECSKDTGHIAGKNGSPNVANFAQAKRYRRWVSRETF